MIQQPPPGLLWVTKARSDIGTQSSPWTANNFFAQGTTASRIDGIGGGGLDYGLSISAGPANTPSAIAIPYTFNFAGDTSYTLGIGDNGNFNGAFQGNIENTTPGSFTSGSTPVISDLYELDPADAGSAGTYLGYFQLDPNGTLTFNPVPEPTTWAMFGMGLITLAAVRKFRRKNQISNL
ncbi:MAG: PEP-CTERM sorting domain-containing protein [Limisphaerales bacterium]